MKSGRLLILAVLAVALGVLASTAYAAPTGPDTDPRTVVPVKPPRPAAPDVSLGAAPAQPAGGGIESLSGSFVVFDPSAGGDACYTPGISQTLCFRAESLTNDWEYVYNLWQRFPTDWTVSNVYVQGTPSCTGSGSWGTFSWSFETSPYEVNIIPRPLPGHHRPLHRLLLLRGSLGHRQPQRPGVLVLGRRQLWRRAPLAVQQRRLHPGQHGRLSVRRGRAAAGLHPALRSGSRLPDARDGDRRGLQRRSAALHLPALQQHRRRRQLWHGLFAAHRQRRPHRPARRRRRQRCDSLL